MSKTIPPFDPTQPHGDIYGESLARFYQNGHNYTAQGQPVEVVDGVERLVGEAPRRDPATVERAGTDQLPPTVNSAEVAKQLDGMKTFEVQAIFKARGGPMDLSKGKGAKQRMVDWLLANA